VVSKYGKHKRVMSEVPLELTDDSEPPAPLISEKREKKKHTFKGANADDDDDDDDEVLAQLQAEWEQKKREKEERQKQAALERQQQMEREQQEREAERERKKKEKALRAKQAGASITAQRAVPVAAGPRETVVASAPTDEDLRSAQAAMEAPGTWIMRDDESDEDEDEPTLSRSQKKNLRKRQKKKQKKTIVLAGGLGGESDTEVLFFLPPYLRESVLNIRVCEVVFFCPVHSCSFCCGARRFSSTGERPAAPSIAGATYKPSSSQVHQPPSETC
jgi:hypothetical protein